MREENEARGDKDDPQTTETFLDFLDTVLAKTSKNRFGAYDCINLHKIYLQYLFTHRGGEFYIPHGNNGLIGTAEQIKKAYESCEWHRVDYEAILKPYNEPDIVMLHFYA